MALHATAMPVRASSGPLGSRMATREVPVETGGAQRAATRSIWQYNSSYENAGKPGVTIAACRGRNVACWRISSPIVAGHR